MTIRELVTKWGLKTDQKKLDKFQLGISVAKVHIASLVTGVVSASGAILALAKTTANYADETLHASTRLGIAADQLQALHYAANLANVGAEEFNTTMSIFLSNMGKAARGDKSAVEAFSRLGISVTDANGKMRSSVSVLKELSGWMLKNTDASERMASARELFGRGGGQMIPLLTEGGGLAAMLADARASGTILTDEQLKMAAEFETKWKRVMAIIVGMKRYVSMQLFPILNPLVDKMLLWWKTNGEIVRTKFDRFITDLRNMEGVAGKLAVAIGTVSTLLSLITAGFMIQGFVTLSGAVFRLTKFMALASAEALLIASSVALVLLLAQDLYAFFQGKDSVFGRISDWIERMLERIRPIDPEYRRGMWEGIGSQGADFSTWDYWKNWNAKQGGSVQKNLTINNFGQTPEQAAETMSRVIDFTLGEQLEYGMSSVNGGHE